jgi:predicted DNA-binding transcriptional regulator YafY
MRADRLISILLILQRKKKVTAAELAAQLEVSERTIYRDVVAMSSAGIPIYTEKGPGGGIMIVDDYRADLVNMSQDEIEALSLLSIPDEFERLGLGESLQSAFKKLKVIQRSAASTPRKVIYIDPSGWHTDTAGQSQLQRIMEALNRQKKVLVRYRFIREMINELIVDVLGIVSKELNWYVVWKMGEKISVRRLSDIVDIRLLAETSEYPPDFDLQLFWEQWCKENLLERNRFEVQLKVAKNALLLFNQLFSEQSELDSETFYSEDVPDWLETRLRFSTLEEARYRLLGLGAAVEVISPKALRWSMHDYAKQVYNRYNI